MERSPTISFWHSAEAIVRLVIYIVTFHSFDPFARRARSATLIILLAVFEIVNMLPHVILWIFGFSKNDDVGGDGDGSRGASNDNRGNYYYIRNSIWISLFCGLQIANIIIIESVLDLTIL